MKKSILTILCTAAVLLMAVPATAQSGLFGLVASAALEAEAAFEDTLPGDAMRLEDVRIDGLLEAVRIRRDHQNVPHIFALNDHDALFMLGWVHAEDRFFQMDSLRRTFSGTLAELVGANALDSDVQFRTLGLRRGAEATLDLLSSESRDWLAAYTDGVNAWLANGQNQLPPEYVGLALTKAGVPAWTDIDTITVSKGLSFGLSFGLDDLGLTEAALTFTTVGDLLGFDGLALFQDDLYRSAPFDPTVSIPGFLGSLTAGPESADKRLLDAATRLPKSLPDYLDSGALEAVSRARRSLEVTEEIRRFLDSRDSPFGSNWWIASGDRTASGSPMLANDPHLALNTPSTFYEVHLRVSGMRGSAPLNTSGVSFAGTAGVILGCSPWLCWGATVNPMDVTDLYLEEVVMGILGPAATIFEGNEEPLVAIPQTYLVNALDGETADNIVDSGIGLSDPGGVVFLVPRRNNGPIVSLIPNPEDPSRAQAVSVQYTGWGPTFEVEAIRGFQRARNVEQFAAALQHFDVGSQNWSVIDQFGDIAYFTSAEMPIREDLQTLNGPAGGIPPWIVRDGTHTLPHEWMAVTNPQPHQAVPFEVLPFAEMPQVRNPAEGFVLNCNNDPVGTTLDNNALNQVRPAGGLYYLSPGYATGFRQGRLRRLFDDAIAGGGPGFTMDDFKAFQANNQLLDAEVFVPFIVNAFGHATAEGADAALAALGDDEGVAEAIGRLANWDFSSPTGIVEGFDPSDDPANLGEPSAEEVAMSVATTIYSAWRGQFVPTVIDGTLEQLDSVVQIFEPSVDLSDLAPSSSLALAAVRNLLDNFEITQGVGASGLNFFGVAGIDDPSTARDVLILQALRGALDLLASDEFAPAFGNSTDQNNYRWGYLHRITFDHILGAPFDIPAGGGLPDLGEDLPGVARAGGLGALDASSHSVRADGLNDFRFGSGPARRFVGQITEDDGVEADEVIPGGTSGVFGSVYQADQLRMWLTNSYKALLVEPPEVVENTMTFQRFEPAGQEE